MYLDLTFITNRKSQKLPDRFWALINYPRFFNNFEHFFTAGFPAFLFGKQLVKVKEYKHQIDKIVYKLYGLTKEGVKIVEQNNR